MAGEKAVDFGAEEESLRQFTAVSGYNDIFLPAMRRLSRSYREYYEALQAADKEPEIKEQAGGGRTAP